MATKTPTKTTKKTTKAKPATGPLSKVKALHGSKEKLVAKIAGSLVHDGADEGTVKERLATASNAQLLRLAEVAEAVKKAYGNRDKLIGALANAQGRAKDKDYVAKLGTFPLPRLYDLAKSAERKAKATAKKA
ncbi:MAG: hypothetical protein R3B06_22855 [Kofleriaceae bacterium]